MSRHMNQGDCEHPPYIHRRADSARRSLAFHDDMSGSEDTEDMQAQSVMISGTKIQIAACYL